MPDFPVSSAKEKALAGRMARFGIREADILEIFVRSSGPGGQNVNKTSTCVYLKHIPTGIEVKCQKDRSQIMNRYFARKLLADKIESMVSGKVSEERKRIEKIKRQKRRRSRRSKEKMLEAKKKHGFKKSFRKKVLPE